MSNNEACEERHKSISLVIRYLVTGVIASFIAIGSFYLYAAEKYCEKSVVDLIRDDIREMRRDIKEDMKVLLNHKH